ncbi:3-methyl-2-oxobutanoate hydroxymethyltransferase [Spiribacter salilacus]|nr:3-methyl-2-oxobutanoate hydroxymethyltransferase [Spiribacter salilacus]
MRVTLSTLQKMRAEQQPIVALTAYDYTFAQAVDNAGVDVVLVGDSLGNVIQGHGSTVPVTVEDIVYHCQCVARGLDRALLMADLPFLSYADEATAIDSAGALMKHGGAQMVKLEGTQDQAAIVEALTIAGVPVCAHIGLQPQLVDKLGGFKVQGKDEQSANRIVEDACALEAAGADLLLVECVSAPVAERIRAAVNLPLIGIGAGVNCDGQVLVLQDVLGITQGRVPRFSRNFMPQGQSIPGALSAYAEAVRARTFPDATECFE